MPISRTQKIVATGAASLGLLLGAAGITAAATTGGSGDSGGSADTEAPAYQSSVTAPEDSSLDGLARITDADAKAKAEAAAGGTAGTAELENENGNVVYGVEVTRPDGSVVDVKVDAGDGTVLATQADDGGSEAGESETADGTESETTDAGRSAADERDGTQHEQDAESANDGR